VDSWEKAYYGETVREESFPTEVDADGDGIVYYCMDNEFEYVNPLDGAEYEAWYSELLQGAELVELEYKAMNAQNVQAINQADGEETKKLPGEGDGPEWYVDRQGTDEIYSELQIKYLQEGKYFVTIGLYRLTTLEGEALLEDEALLFEDEMFGVKGIIRVQGKETVFEVTESKFEYMKAGETFVFPEKL